MDILDQIFSLAKRGTTLEDFKKNLSIQISEYDDDQKEDDEKDLQIFETCRLDHQYDTGCKSIVFKFKDGILIDTDQIH